MALFKKKNNEYELTSDKMNTSNTKSCDRIIFEQLNNDDEKIASLVDQMRLGKPLIIDFSRLNVADGNKMLSFLEGACYVSDARCVLIKEKIFLFARNIDFLDGSLSDYISKL